MRLTSRITAGLALLACLAAPPAARGTTLIQMGLGDLCARAERIFTGTVLKAVPGEVTVGGGRLPVVTYLIGVDEAFKGTFSSYKGERVAEVTMLGKLPEKNAGDLRRPSLLGEMPRLEVGRSYMLFTSRPGATGLSAPIGLGQGCFTLAAKGQGRQAVNGYDNVGLFGGGTAGLVPSPLPASGPVDYADLASAVRAELGR